jgi:hypothetical protein
MRLVGLRLDLGLGLGLGLGLALALAACSDTPLPTPTQTVCPDPDPGTLTWDNFGRPFMETYCTMCHSATLLRSARNGAPLFHDFDTLQGVLYLPEHIDEQAGSGPAASNSSMPPERCPSTPGGPLSRDCARPSEEERQNLSLWVACEVQRNR